MFLQTRLPVDELMLMLRLPMQRHADAIRLVTTDDGGWVEVGGMELLGWAGDGIKKECSLLTPPSLLPASLCMQPLKWSRTTFNVQIGQQRLRNSGPTLASTTSHERFTPSGNQTNPTYVYLIPYPRATPTYTPDDL